MEDISKDFPQLNTIANSIQYKILRDENDAAQYCYKIPSPYKQTNSLYTNNLQKGDFVK